jgi:ABC-type dipeptide/oligopeptide/nickel transport system permease subunit
MDNTYTIIPWSPTQSRAVFYSRVPSSSVGGSYQLVADERLADGIVFYVQTVSFNLKSTEDFPVSREVEGRLAEFLMLGEGADRLKTMSRELEEVGGISPEVIDRFRRIGAGLRGYEKSILEGKAEEAMAQAELVGELVAGFEPRNRNARIMIEDASDELKGKIDARINFVFESEKVGDTSYGDRHFMLGTDPIGRDVLSQMLHACRLSISIGLVSTGLSVLIGIVIGSLMGYFGGWVDLVLSRVVEIFMAIPVLFLLIVAASVLPRNTYVMMAIIGCVTWTGSARFIRAEFLKLRNQDFVQSCRAVGLPLHSTLFRHMLPNGVTPVLVQASFGIAAAIIAEATLSYLGLGPYGQSSWGKLLSLTTGETGVFLWWMAVFPGVAIFLTVLAYNVLGENLRDAIDPKMRKAAH